MVTVVPQNARRLGHHFGRHLGFFKILFLTKLQKRLTAIESTACWIFQLCVWIIFQ